VNADLNRGSNPGLGPRPDPEPDPDPDGDAPVEPELAVDLCGVPLATPILAASGCFGFGREMSGLLDLAAIGGVVTKSVSLEPRRGRPTPRMAETPSGMLNAIGLQNPGVEAFCKTDLQFLREAGARVAVSVVGRSAEEFARVAERLAGEDAVDLLELNLSCPNVDSPGEVFAADPSMAALVVRTAKSVARQPVLAKLTADVTDVVAIARACVEAGADGLTLINTLLGMAVDVRRRRPKLAAVTGGLSGPAIRPVAVRCVWQVASAMPEVPIVGLGGVMTGEDAAELLLVGATAVQVGTANFINPLATADVADQLRAYLQSQRIASVTELPTLFKAER
jgi:dihydroorotate dehydrogenase (NAD+) catalytic subunit